MKSKIFSTDVELECRVFWGPEGNLEFPGTAAGPNRLTLRAEVVRVTETGDSLRQPDLNFRKAAFKDVVEGGRSRANKPLKKAATQ